MSPCFPKIVLAAALFILPTTGHCFCFQQAADEYHLSPRLLYAVGKWESRLNAQSINWNTNGTYDYGVMNINSSWEPTLRKNGINWASLADPCTNVRVGAWILAQCLNKYGNTWEGVGCYNSQTPSKRNKYANYIYQTLVKIDREPAQTTLQKGAIKPPAITEIASITTDNKTPWEMIIDLDSFQ